jgi:outer membrane protein
MSQRMGLRPIVACSALFVFSQLASAQTKVAVVNLQQAVFDSAEIKKADADMQARYKPRSDQAQKLQAELSNIAQQLQGGKGRLTPQAEAELNADGNRKQRELQRLNEDLQADVDRDRNEVLGKASQKMTEVVRKLADQKGFDLVVDTSTALYFKPAMDLTKEAVTAYDQAYPVTAAAASAPAAKK